MCLIKIGPKGYGSSPEQQKPVPRGEQLEFFCLIQMNLCTFMVILALFLSGGALLNIGYGGRIFDRFVDPNDIQGRPGIYVIISRKSVLGESTILDIGDAEDLRERLNNNERFCCWIANAKGGGLRYDIHYTDNMDSEKRASIMLNLRDEYSPCCSGLIVKNVEIGEFCSLKIFVYEDESVSILSIDEEAFKGFNPTKHTDPCLLTENYSRKIKQYTLNFHTPHGDWGQKHVHGLERNKQFFSINIDGSTHDGFHNVKIPNKLIKALRKEGFNIPPSGITENIGNEDLETICRFV